MTFQLAGAALAFLAAAAAPPATPTPTYVCSNDSFSIDGRQVSVALCVADNAAKRSPDGKRTIVTISERLASSDLTYSRDVVLDFLTGAELSRTIDDIPLDKIGIQKQLHLTIGYRPGSVQLEHALLIPGAVALK